MRRIEVGAWIGRVHPTSSGMTSDSCVGSEGRRCYEVSEGVSMRRPCAVLRFCHRPAVIALGFALLLIGCGESVEQDGPGPVGPVGPVGTTGDEVGEPGSGVIVSEERDVGNVTRVLFGSEGDVRISIGEQTSLTVEADDNVLPHVETEVEEDILRIRTAEGIDIAPSRPPRFHIVLRGLTEVELSGVGDIEVESVESQILSVALSGVGDITLRDVDVDLLLYDLVGVGTVSIAGSAEDQNGQVGGQCSYYAADLESERARLQASGGGYAVISVVSRLSVSATDNAAVEYYGSPSVSQQIGDLGSVTGLGER